uniref:Dynein cytoplasmic 1 intermediate chain 2 n=1 Tax=Oryzias sinensis TaxID=183150 RepID=A0A8C7ZV05_9TELE
MSDKSELKAELERKKQRLAQIREEKRRKEEERKKTDQQLKEAALQADDSDLEKKRREAEALLQSVGITTDVSAVPAPTSPVAKSVGTPSEAGSQDSDGAAGPRHVTRKLGMAKVTQVDFPPRETVSYSKETQTPAMTPANKEEEEEEEIAAPQPKEEIPSEKVDQKEEEEAPPHELTEEEKLQILHSEEFTNFFDHSTRIIERALSEHVDIFFDYVGQGLDEKESEIQAGAKLSLNRQFMDERWSKHRVVTCLDWSPQYPELLVASYNNNEEAPHEPDGVALVWNMKYKKTTPEFVFHCQHPVYCVNVVGTQNAHNLISISTDGKICSWSLDMLSQPQDSMELVFKQSKAVAVTSMSFPLGDVNNFVVGSEDGSVYMSCRHGSKAGISEMFEGHHGPITGIHCHTAAGPLDFSHLFVTSSFDWTVKLWSTKVSLYYHLQRPKVLYSPIYTFTLLDGNPALNKLRWGHSGREIAVGDSDGRVLVYEVGEQVAVPRNDEWTRFVRTLAEINENRDDAEELAAQRLAA